MIRIIALALCTAPVCAEAADEPLAMTPSSQWVVDYADDSCALRRAFSAGNDKAFPELRQYGPDEYFEVMVLSDTVTRRERAPRVRFEPDAAWYEPPTPRLVDSGARHGVLYQDSLRPRGATEPQWSGPDREARERAITGLTVVNSFERDLTLQTGTMDKPMEAMRTCIQDLVSQWGLDEGAPGPLARGPVPVGLQDWARRTQEYYPPDMVWAGKNARVSVRLIVGKDGRPRSCHANGSNEPSFIQAACGSLMQYARFEPAIDGNGEPVIGTYTTTIVYKVF